MNMQFTKLASKRTFALIAVALFAIAGGFAILKAATWISVPYRDSATSSIETKRIGNELHFITQNTRFTMVELAMPPSLDLEWLVMRETFYRDEIDGQVGMTATVTVELTDGKHVRWSFSESGLGGGMEGEIVGDYVYRVTKDGCCDAPPTFVYFSLIDGRMLQTGHDALSHEQLRALDESLAK
jgi:hypothetical protein